MWLVCLHLLPDSHAAELLRYDDAAGSHPAQVTDEAADLHPAEL